MAATAESEGPDNPTCSEASTNCFRNSSIFLASKVVLHWLQFEESHPFCNKCHSLTFSLVKQIVLKIAATNECLFAFLQLFLHFNKFTGHALKKCLEVRIMF